MARGNHASAPPRRIRLSRAKGFRLPKNAVVVSRPSVWGNPFKVGEKMLDGSVLTREKAVELYEQWVRDGGWPRVIRRRLRGKDLACWCPLDEPCHADVLLRIANAPDA